MKKLFLLIIFLLSVLSFLAISTTHSKPAMAVLQACGTATCDSTKCTTVPTCNGPLQCKTQCEGCSHANLNQCAMEWALGIDHPLTDCALGSICNPGDKYKCDTTATPNACIKCAAGDTSCAAGTTATSCGCPGQPPIGPPPVVIPPSTPTCDVCTAGHNYNNTVKPAKCYFVPLFSNPIPLPTPMDPTKIDCGDKLCSPGCGCYDPSNPSDPCIMPTGTVLGNLPCGTDGSGCKTAVGTITADLKSIVGQLFVVLLSIGGSIAVLIIIWAGYKLMVSRGNPEAIQNAREQLTAAIVGLLFIIFSILILQVIGGDILKIPKFQ